MLIDNEKFFDDVLEQVLEVKQIPINDIPLIALNEKLEDFPSLSSSLALCPNDRGRVIRELEALFALVGLTTYTENTYLVISNEAEHLPEHRILSIRTDENFIVFRYEQGDVATVEKIPWIFFVEILVSKHPCFYRATITGLGISVRYLKYSDKWRVLFPELANTLLPKNDIPHLRINSNEFIIGGYHIKYSDGNGLVNPEE